MVEESTFFPPSFTRKTLFVYPVLLHAQKDDLKRINVEVKVTVWGRRGGES